MTVDEFTELIKERKKINPRIGEDKLVIPIHIPGNVGGTPCEEVRNIRQGIDWDHHKVFLITEHKLKAIE
jgi:hypothetical protein